MITIMLSVRFESVKGSSGWPDQILENALRVAPEGDLHLDPLAVDLAGRGSYLRHQSRWPGGTPETLDTSIS